MKFIIPFAVLAIFQLWLHTIDKHKSSKKYNLVWSVIWLVSLFIGYQTYKRISKINTQSVDITVLKDSKLELETNHIELKGKNEVLVQELNSLKAKHVLGRIATLNSIAREHPMSYASGPVAGYVDLSRYMLDALDRSKTKMVPKLKDEIALTNLLRAVKEFPEFPFGHYHLSLFLKDIGDDQWKVHAKKALEILTITVTMNGHNKHHDDVLQDLQEILD